MLRLKDCEENNLCVDCKNEKCAWSGKAISDCPKYDCDNDPMYECENCAFLKVYQKECRIFYLYKNNADFRQYVDRYCKTYNLSVEEALQHVIVKEVAKEYAEGE